MSQNHFQLEVIQQADPRCDSCGFVLPSQTASTGRNVGDVLRAAGTDFGNVLKWTMYTTDIDEFSKNADVYKRHFINSPASTLVEVRRLIFPEMLVEIEAVASLP